MWETTTKKMHMWEASIATKPNLPPTCSAMASHMGIFQTPPTCSAVASHMGIFQTGPPHAVPWLPTWAFFKYTSHMQCHGFPHGHLTNWLPTCSALASHMGILQTIPPHAVPWLPTCAFYELSSHMQCHGFPQGH